MMKGGTPEVRGGWDMLYARWVETVYCWGRGGQFSYRIVSSSLESLELSELAGNFLDSLEVVITAEMFSGERELCWSEAEPAEVEWEELVMLDVFLLAMPLEDDLSSLSSVLPS